jgi:CHAT domain-containing protein
VQDCIGLQQVLARTPGLLRYRRALMEATIGSEGAPSAALFADPRHRIVGRAGVWTDGSAHHAAPLAGSELEAAEIEADLGRRFRFVPEGRPYLRDEATLGRFLAALDEHPWLVHFTGHGGYASSEPHLCFADTGVLSARGLVGRRFRGGPAVVLNCCMAGFTEAVGGAYRGLTDAFLSRGAAVVVASSFPVYDFPSRLFSKRFYDRLLGGATVGEAILGARRAVASEPGSHPLHWALFAPWGNVNARLALP